MSQLVAGLVVREQSGFFGVETCDGQVRTCRLRGRLLEEARSSDVAAIGDRVQIEIQPDGTGAIEAVAERISVLSRAVRTEGVRGAGAPAREQVIVANADQALFVFAAANPEPSFKTLDRFLTAGEKSGIERLVIVVNKQDLTDSAAVRARFLPYERIGYTVLHTCALDGTGVDALRARLQGCISVFAGPSGVGKTSLLNAIQPDLGRAVKEVSGWRDEGVHTTRDSVLVRLEQGGYIADTPGIRSAALYDVEPEELDGYFRDIAPYVGRCRFNDCAHQDEPGCAVIDAVRRHEISRARWRSYLALREELTKALEAY